MPSLDFQSVHKQFRPKILRYLSRLVGAAEAEDVAQSVLLKVSEALPGFRGDSTLSTWIYRIATNAALDRLRHKTPATELEFEESDAPPSAQSPSAEASAIREEMNECIHEFIERLPGNYRTVMVLSELEGFKNDEIAAILDVSLDTVKIRLHRARARLRRDLESGCNFYRDERGELACDREPATVIKFAPRQ